MNDPELTVFAERVAAAWQKLAAPGSGPRLRICDLQEQTSFYFGNADLGLLDVLVNLTASGYRATFEHMFSTPFTILATAHLDSCRHLALVKVHTSFACGVPALPSASELEEMRQFAALMYNQARFQSALFGRPQTGTYFCSSPCDSTLASIGYAWVQQDIDGSSRLVRARLLDYIYDVKPTPERLRDLMTVYQEIGRPKTPAPGPGDGRTESES
jgi:hypothetical protein